MAIDSLPAGDDGVVYVTIDTPRPAVASKTKITNRAEIRDDGANGLDSKPADNIDYEVTPVWYKLFLMLASSGS